MAERYQARQREADAAVAARVTTQGGMAEMIAGRQYQVAAVITADERMGGMAQLYRDQELTLRVGE